MLQPCPPIGRAAMLFVALGLQILPRHAAADSSGYTQTRYPIVLVHGAGGFDRLMDSYDYWYGIVKALQEGGAEVYVVHLSPYNSTEVRGEQLLAQIETIVAITGRARVNLIGHSHGGLTVRYPAAVRPDLVASVTSVSGPHGCVALADYFNTDPLLRSAPSLAFFNLTGDLAELLSGHRDANDAAATLQSVTSAGIKKFNASYPAGLPKRRCGSGAPVENGVYYYSWSGTAVQTNPWDFSDSIFNIASQLYKSEPNDGIIDHCSTHLGEVIRDDYPMNHADTVNQFFGLIGSRGPNPTSLFRVHANRLKNAGL